MSSKTHITSVPMQRGLELNQEHLSKNWYQDEKLELHEILDSYFTVASTDEQSLLADAFGCMGMAFKAINGEKFTRDELRTEISGLPKPFEMVVGKAQFDDVVKKTNGDKVIAVAFSRNCKACAKIKPELIKAAEEIAKTTGAKIKLIGIEIPYPIRGNKEIKWTVQSSVSVLGHLLPNTFVFDDYLGEQRPKLPMLLVMKKKEGGAWEHKMVDIAHEAANPYEGALKWLGIKK